MKELEFTRLVREYRKTIYTVCYFFSNNPQDVDDLFQEVLVNLWKSFPKFRGDSSPKTWIWRVSLNTCCNVERGKKRIVPTVPLVIDKGVMSDSDEGGRQIKMLYDRINRLELFDRAIILLWLESMRYDEIAAIVGLTPAALTNRLFRIKEQLKSMSNN
ncbi:MAG: sigma-70 family RNA polymerase sigma factor [Bacteroidaceae bacterium]|nr:sigma-70 family RNA polymerase sigma factor [Bacteroidaceae bacterium]